MKKYLRTVSLLVALFISLSFNTVVLAKGDLVKAEPTRDEELAQANPLEQEVIKLVNQERAKNGLKPLKQDTLLMKVARLKSEDMSKNNYFSHTSPSYGTPFQMMRNFGVKYYTAGENIAKGQTSAKAVMNSWMNSQGHRANILKSAYTDIGVGASKDKNGVIYWTQMFIGK